MGFILFVYLKLEGRQRLNEFYAICIFEIIRTDKG